MNIYIKNISKKNSRKKFNLVVIKLFINFKKSKFYFVIIEIFRIIKSIIFTFKQNFKFKFKNLNYIITKIKFIKIDLNNNVYFDINYNIIFINRT